MISTTVYAALALVLASTSDAHIAMYNKGLFGYNWPGQAGDAKQNYNANDVVGPLRQNDHLTEEEWFAHGYKKYPPKAGDFMDLETGGTFTGDLGCNRALTHMRDPKLTKPLDYYACPDKGPLHTANEFNKPARDSAFGGTALAIAYTSDVDSLKPNDMTVISVNHSGVWEREVVYEIPPNMPECPAGGCLCTWNWFHTAGNGEGYGFEFYNLLYRCRITGDTSNTTAIPVSGGSWAKLCEDNASDCVAGPKVPMYAWMVSGNNVDVPDDEIPSYNMRYGFKNGAQTDILTTIAAPVANTTTTANSTTTVAASSTSTESSTTQVSASTSEAIAASSAAASSTPSSGGERLLPAVMALMGVAAVALLPALLPALL